MSFFKDILEDIKFFVKPQKTPKRPYNPPHLIHPQPVRAGVFDSGLLYRRRQQAASIIRQKKLAEEAQAALNLDSMLGHLDAREARFTTTLSTVEEVDEDEINNEELDLILINAAQSWLTFDEQHHEIVIS